MIHPARFLFNAGSTPKSWNDKMLNDEHLKIPYYEPDSNKVFPGLSTPIKGGIAISYRDDKSNYGAIKAFTQFTELNAIMHKVIDRKNFESLSNIVYTRTAYRLTPKMHEDNPWAIERLSEGHAYDMSSNIINLLPEIFLRTFQMMVWKENVKELLNFFPVIGEDEQGELVELDAEKVLTIPRKIRYVEVVKRGFMSNFLFQNISNIFGAPKEVIDIITKFEPIEEPKSKVNLTEEVQKDLSLDENGEVALSDEFVIGRTQDVFGNKIYDVTSQVQKTMTQMEQAPDKAQKAIDKLKESVKQSAVKAVVDTAQSTYGYDMKAADKRQIESKLNHEADRMIDKLHTNYEIERNVIENQRVAEQQARYETGKTSEQIDKEFEKKQKEREKETIEDGVRDHLRGFSRTIPSFLMAYGDNTVTLATFDTIIPDTVFLEVTSITLDKFKFLRDGGDYVEEETGQTKQFEGQLFDSVVFDDSVK